MNKILKQMFAGVVTLLVATGCIDNDIPYPIVKLDILSLEANGLKSAAVIDAKTKSVML